MTPFPSGCVQTTLHVCGPHIRCLSVTSSELLLCSFFGKAKKGSQFCCYLELFYLLIFFSFHSSP